MKIISGIVVLSVCLVISNVSFALLLDNSKTMPGSGDSIEDVGANAKVCFAAMESLIKDSYKVDSLADLGEDGVKLQAELGIIYNQLIAGSLSLKTHNVEFDMVEFEDWDGETRNFLELSYNFTGEDGEEYQKSLLFKYELLDNDSRINPNFIVISEAKADIMNPPSFYYFFEEDGARFEEIF